MTTTKLISSQTFRHEPTVDAKSASHDYTVTVVTLPELGFAVVVDGHHSLTAAARDGVEPEIIECYDAETLSGLEDEGQWLLAHWIDSEYRFIDAATGETTGQLVF